MPVIDEGLYQALRFCDVSDDKIVVFPRSYRGRVASGSHA